MLSNSYFKMNSFIECQPYIHPNNAHVYSNNMKIYEYLSNFIRFLCFSLYILFREHFESFFSA